MEYRLAFIWGFVANITRKIVEYVNIWIIISNFQSIAGWDFFDLLLLYNVNQFAISFSGMIFWNPMIQLEEFVHKGTLDTLLTKPVALLPHLLFRTFDVSFLANLSLSSIMFIYYFKSANIVWDTPKIILLNITILSAILIYSSLHVFIGALSFYIVKVGSIFSTVMDFRRFVYYPITIYHPIIRVLLTYVFPIAFVNYYPMLYILGKTTYGDVPTVIYPFVSMLIGVGSFILSYIFFDYGSKRYLSAGG